MDRIIGFHRWFEEGLGNVSKSHKIHLVNMLLYQEKLAE